MDLPAPTETNQPAIHGKPCHWLFGLRDLWLEFPIVKQTKWLNNRQKDNDRSQQHQSHQRERTRFRKSHGTHTYTKLRILFKSPPEWLTKKNPEKSRKKCLNDNTTQTAWLVRLHHFCEGKGNVREGCLYEQCCSVSNHAKQRPIWRQSN